MKFVPFRRDNRTSSGLLVDGDRVLDLGEVPGRNAKTALDVVLAGEDGVAAARDAARRANAVGQSAKGNTRSSTGRNSPAASTRTTSR